MYLVFFNFFNFIFFNNYQYFFYLIILKKINSSLKKKFLIPAVIFKKGDLGFYNYFFFKDFFKKIYFNSYYSSRFLDLKKKTFSNINFSFLILKKSFFLKKRYKTTMSFLSFYKTFIKNFKVLSLNYFISYVLLKNKIILNYSDFIFLKKKKFIFLNRSRLESNFCLKSFFIEIFYFKNYYFYLIKIKNSSKKKYLVYKNKKNKIVSKKNSIFNLNFFTNYFFKKNNNDTFFYFDFFSLTLVFLNFYNFSSSLNLKNNWFSFFMSDLYFWKK